MAMAIQKSTTPDKESLTSMLPITSTMLRILFHLIGALHFCYGCYYDFIYVRIPSTSSTVTPFGGKLKYLTFINAMLQTVYFTVALCNDLFGNNEPTHSDKPIVRRIKDTIFTSLAFPLAMFVGITFWCIYAVDRAYPLKPTPLKTPTTYDNNPKCVHIPHNCPNSGPLLLRGGSHHELGKKGSGTYQSNSPDRTTGVQCPVSAQTHQTAPSQSRDSNSGTARARSLHTPKGVCGSPAPTTPLPERDEKFPSYLRRTTIPLSAPRDPVTEQPAKQTFSIPAPRGLPLGHSHWYLLYVSDVMSEVNGVLMYVYRVQALTPGLEITEVGVAHNANSSLPFWRR
ncbi:unnamed protein product [Diatraea saccharalis]|uniref:Uncharacterized protein n=1 Tax=Diatraea saccharalis TaxID=40085 RepID=A0A9N9R3C4_9NEOP|nr:unnamed protein product [Diatraea saccharalis]